MTAEIYDFDNAIYKDPDNKNDIFLNAAILAACQLKPEIPEDEIIRAAMSSYANYGTDFAVFVEKYDVQESDIHPLYHRLAMKDIFEGVQPSLEIRLHFQDRISASVPFSIVTHGSHEWLLYGLKKLGLDDLFDPNLLLAVDMPEINYQYKNLSLHSFQVAADRMGVSDLSKIRFFDDSRSNLRMAHTANIETVLVHWGDDSNKHDDPDYISRKVCNISDYTL